MDISFIIINYRSRDLLKRCVESIFKYARNFSFEIIVVNNDEQPLINFLDSDKINITECNINNGFASASNLGARKANGKILFFLNADTELLDYSIADILKAFNDPAIGAAAPKLVVADMSPQPWGSGYEVSILDTLKNNFGLVKSRSAWLQEKTVFVDWASGAALAVPREIFEKCGGFDEKFFMYFEDVDLCKRIRHMDKKILLLPHIKILHTGGQSKSSAKEQKKQYYLSQDYYFKKNFGNIQACLIKFLRNIALLFGK